jgi:hypothetical protein
MKSPFLIDAYILPQKKLFVKIFCLKNGCLLLNFLRNCAKMMKMLKGAEAFPI